MDTKEIKKEIIDRIIMFDDQEFLMKINKLLQNHQSERFIELSPDMNAKLNHASTQIKEGKFIEQQDLDASVEKWLNEE